MILNKDGTPYKPSGSIKQYNPNNKTQELFNKYDQEVAQLYGSPIYYYEVMIQFNSIDKLYLEDRSKLWKPNPITLYATYEPIEPQNPSTNFGIDGMGDVVFQTNARYVWNTLRGYPKRGSRIHTPHLAENWVVVDYKLTTFQGWGSLHLQIVCERFQDNLTDASTLNRNPEKEYNIV